MLPKYILDIANTYMSILNIISPFVLKKKINILAKKTKFLIFVFGSNGN